LLESFGRACRHGGAITAMCSPDYISRNKRVNIAKKGTNQPQNKEEI
jgi:hypothetical protein